MDSPGYAQKSGSSKSTTGSVISGGLVITDSAGQIAKTGKTAEETEANVNQSTTEKVEKQKYLKQNWDGGQLQEEVQADSQIVQAFGQQASKAVGDLADAQERAALKKAANETDPAERQKDLDEAGRWAEGGAYRVMAHAAVGGLTGNLVGAVGAGASALSAPMLNKLTDGMPEGVKELVGTAVAMGIGAAAGGAAGGSNVALNGAEAAANEDMNNRQLHPDELAWLKKNAKTFAEEQGISEDKALQELTQQALKQVDFLWRSELSDGDNAAAEAFLKTAGTFANDLDNSQKMFTVEGQQLLRPEMYLVENSTPDNLSFYKQYAQSGITRKLSEGSRQELAEMAVQAASGLKTAGEFAIEHPADALGIAGNAVTEIPGEIWNGIKETPIALGEGAAAALNGKVFDSLLVNLYGTSDAASAEDYLVGARVLYTGASLVGAVKVAGGIKKIVEKTAEAGGELSEVGAVGNVSKAGKEAAKAGQTTSGAMIGKNGVQVYSKTLWNRKRENRCGKPRARRKSWTNSLS